MKYQLNAKMVASLVATTLIVSGLAYAATTITSTTQMVENNDIMSAAWFNEVNTKISTIPPPQQGSILLAKTLSFSSSAAWNETMNAYMQAFPGSQWANKVQASCLAPNADTLPSPMLSGDVGDINFCIRIACIQKGFTSIATPGYDYCTNASTPECVNQFGIKARCISTPAESIITY